MSAQPSAPAAREQPFWLSPRHCDLDDFIRLTSRTTLAADYPFAASVQSNVLVYDCDALRQLEKNQDALRTLQAEWGRALQDGPGVVVLAGAVPDATVIDAVSSVFQSLIDKQHASGKASGDHFARPGANDRIWNAQQKLCLRAPQLFARYFANPAMAWISTAWLGPGYQMTAQVNVVNPGGAAQSPHRDYHLGFQSESASSSYPAHVHAMSPMLTLQGAVAHCDMPLESGPTLYLPYSQLYHAGYLAYHQQQFRDYFEQHHVQLPLAKGDAVFFNPALFHAAGHNRSGTIRRMANLLQVSSPFGRAMEVLDRHAMSCTLYPALRALREQGLLSASDARHAIAACAEGYAFPGNLDRDPPVGGMAPATQQQIMQQALEERWPATRMVDALDSKNARQQP